MKIKLYNTITRQKDDFKPLRDSEVGIYSCGPTVYDFAHIGNLRAYVFSDILVRMLRFAGFKVKWAMNITDVGHLTSDNDEGEDKIEKAAQKAKTTAEELAEKYTQSFLTDLVKLNIEKPNILPRATEHIREQIDLISKIEKAGFAYRISDGIYFDTSKIKDYPELFGILSQGLKARVESNPEKKHVSDFALWKFSSQGQKRQMEWNSPWGKGFPGWHIECTAMSEKYLGKLFDIHTGGVDHIPIHHKNEIAQSEAAFGTKLANFWLHAEFLLVNGQKMAKSENNFYTLKEVIDKGFRPLSLRYFYLENHYRAKMNFTWEGLEKAQKTLMGIYVLVANNNRGQDLSKEIDEALGNDLDIPTALSILHKAGDSDLWKKYEPVLGLGINKVKNMDGDKELDEKIRKREELRKQGNYKEADKIREELEKKGILIEDTSQGPRAIRIP